MVVVRCFGCFAPRQGVKVILQGTSPPRSARHCYITHPFAGIQRWHSTRSWTAPADGHDTGITIFNSATKSKVPLLTTYKGILSWYSCGPTVYDSAHIGHAVNYVKQDIIRRIMTRLFDLNVIMVMGITDIDDKIINRANELKVGVRDISEKYEQEFFSDMDRLRVWRPCITPRVTHHVPHIIHFVEGILARGMAYVAPDSSVYFNTEAYGRYGKLTPLPPISDDSHIQVGTELKKSARDFALWKAAKPGEPSWESPWGPGRPGWHVECSAMSCHILGSPLDLHSGGMDLLFAHHENEEAQCCAFHNIDQWCNYWLHTGLLHTKQEQKMSKSLSNTISISELLDHHSANSFRFLCLLSHYRHKIVYTPNSMSQAESHLKRILSFLQDAYAYINGQYKSGPVDEPALKKKLMDTRLKVRQSLADDFDTAKAVDAVLELVSLGNKELQKKPEGSTLAQSAGCMVAVCSYIHFLMEDVFGITFPSLADASNLTLEGGGRLAEVLDAVVKLRGEIRNFALLQGTHSQDLTKSEKDAKRKERRPLLDACDDLRTELLKSGLQIKDRPSQTVWTVAEQQQG